MGPDFDPVVNGIFLLLGILLLVSSILQFVNGTRKNYALAFICLITCMWFFRRFFWRSWVEYPILYIVFGGTKEVFIAPLVYFHVKMKHATLTTKEALKHLFVPIIIYLTFLILVYFFIDFQRSINKEWTYVLTWYVLICFTVYFTLSYKELKKKVKPVVIPKVYKTVFWFLVFYCIPYTFSFFTSVISLGILWYAPEDSDFLRRTVNGTWIYRIDWAILNPSYLSKRYFWFFMDLWKSRFSNLSFIPKRFTTIKK